jgi:hypothetical protein
MDASGGISRAEQTQTASQTMTCKSLQTGSTTHQENALHSKHPLRYSSQNTNRCTSNVNPPYRLRGNDEAKHKKK